MVFAAFEAGVDFGYKEGLDFCGDCEEVISDDIEIDWLKDENS